MTNSNSPYIKPADTRQDCAEQNNHQLQNIVYIGLGSNLSNPKEQVEMALKTLSSSDKIQLITYSSLYKTAPIGPQDQDDFINAVCKIKTVLSPLELLHFLQNIEKQQGRVRKSVQWGPRTLDLDILLYNNEQFETEQLTVPHYAMQARAFVLFPLQEIASDLTMPNGTAITDLTKTIDVQGIIKLC